MSSLFDETYVNYFDFMAKVSNITDNDVDEILNIFEKLNYEEINSDKFKKKLTNQLPYIKSVKVLELYFKYGADPNGKDNCGCPVLISSCISYSYETENHNKIIETFIKHGADPYTKHPYSGKTIIDNSKYYQALSYQYDVLKKYEL